MSGENRTERTKGGYEAENNPDIGNPIGLHERRLPPKPSPSTANASSTAGPKSDWMFGCARAGTSDQGVNGADAIGKYVQTTIHLQSQGVPLTERIRRYQDRPVSLFSVTYEAAAPKPVVAFPDFDGLGRGFVGDGEERHRPVLISSNSFPLKALQVGFANGSWSERICRWRAKHHQRPDRLFPTGRSRASNLTP